MNIIKAFYNLLPTLRAVPIPDKAPSCQQDKRQYPVVAVFLQGAAAHAEQFRHFLVRQVSLPIQWRTVTSKKSESHLDSFRIFCSNTATDSQSIVITLLSSFIIISVLSQTRLSVSGANRTDKRDEPFHIFRLVVKTEADLRITDKTLVTQFLQRALLILNCPQTSSPVSHLPSLLALPLALQGGDLLHEGIRLCHHFLEVFFSIDTISIYKTIFEFAAKVTARAETPIGFV